MSSFFQQTAKARIAKHLDRFPLLKLDQVIDWRPIERYLNSQKQRRLTTQQGRPSYPVLAMFKAVLLGQWHSLSDPELEHSLVTRIDFTIFCGFDDMDVPDHSTLCRYRNWLAEEGLLDKLLVLINQQLSEKGLKVAKAQTAVVDATIIQTAGRKKMKAIEQLEDGEYHESAPSTDKDARWTKKGADFHLGFKLHARSDGEGYIEKLNTTPANVHEVNQLEPLVNDLEQGTRVEADKGYSSAKNRKRLQALGLEDGIMQKAHRGSVLTREQIERNKRLSKTRYVIEQSFGTLHRIFKHKRASYFSLVKVHAQSLLKAICINCLKAANKLRIVAPNFA